MGIKVSMTGRQAQEWVSLLPGISARGMCVRIAGAADRELYVPECGCDQIQGYAAVK